MKKTCPDLVAKSDEELRQFWAAHNPEDLKLIGDRLLAESLPDFPPRGPEFYPGDLRARRKRAGITLEAMCTRLGVTRNLLRCWESQDIRPPASLSLLYPGE